MRAAARSARSGRTIVDVSIDSLRAVPATAATSGSSTARVSGCHGRLLEIMTSAPKMARASPTSVTRTFWMIERSATIAPTPTATQI